MKPNWMAFNRVENIQSIVQLEPLLILLSMLLGAWVLYKGFLREMIPARHLSLRRHFKNVLGYTAAAVILFALYWGLTTTARANAWVGHLANFVAPYIGIVTIVLGAIVLVKVCRILAFEYLFAVNMKVGVPVLIVNIFSLLLSLVLAFWFLSAVFSINLAPILATSAIFSLVLGLALQDTLGNLCAGIAIQLDKPYEIGDWIEVEFETQKWVGCVKEISWRATLLISFTDELITVPNRTMTQAEISNYSAKSQPVIRGHYLYVPYGTSLSLVKRTLREAVVGMSDLRKYPAPNVLILEAAESWIKVKLLYWIDDFGNQFVIGDRVLEKVFEALAAAGIELASPRIKVSRAENPKEA